MAQSSSSLVHGGYTAAVGRSPMSPPLQQGVRNWRPRKNRSAPSPDSHSCGEEQTTHLLPEKAANLCTLPTHASQTFSNLHLAPRQ
ncbi:hypothetical protein EYF80_031684 [Liparis tanakae]|uniref:Uncharacterized protein n=1 Tax=Liparis tanakae TaxID=230148 RepID=A0A4Z2GYA2_9TELE|nr:hypothetical protein EYF80_031684 [Liparis tanakae]